MGYGNRKGCFKNTKKELFEMVRFSFDQLLKKRGDARYNLTYKQFIEQIRIDHRTDFSTRLRQHSNIKNWIDDQLSKNNFELCCVKGCNEEPHFFLKNGYMDLVSGRKNKIKKLCEKHYVQHLEKQAKKNQKRKIVANDKALVWFETHFDKIKKLKLKHKKETLKLIEDFYAQYTLSEPHFRTMLVDVLRLQNGNPAAEFPLYTKNTQHRLNPKRVDILERKFGMAIECKASFFGSHAQSILKEQLREYKRGYPKFEAIAVSPDDRHSVSSSLYNFLKIICEKNLYLNKKRGNR